MSVQNSAQLKVLAREYRKVYTLQRKSHLCISRKGIARLQSQFPHSCVWERFIGSVHIFSSSKIGSPIMRIYKSLTQYYADDRKKVSVYHGTNGVLLYLEGKVQLKHFYKNQSIDHILCSQTNNGAALVPDSETSSRIRCHIGTLGYMAGGPVRTTLCRS
jgi:hypothetical protein